jgi:amino acid adenylation domain-containing protein
MVSSFLSAYGLSNAVSNLSAAMTEMPFSTTVPSLFAKVVERYPHAVAVASGGGTLTYSEIDSLSTSVAGALRAAGLSGNDPVGLYFDSSADFVVAALGVWKAGGAYLPVDPAYPTERARFIVSDSGAPVILTRREHASRLSGGSWTVLCIEEISPTPHHASAAFATATVDDLAYIIYTSGSTGVPKGVEITHGNLLNLVEWHNGEFSVTAQDRATQVAGPGFDAAVWELWPYLSAGAAIHIPSSESRYSASRLRDWLVSEKITISFLPTVLTEEVLRLSWPAETALRFLLTGGDALHLFPSPDIPFVLVNNYGPTECTVVATSAQVRAQAGDLSAPSIGRAILNTNIHLLSESGHPVAHGETGEIYIAGASVGRGYRNRPDLTAEGFVTIRVDGVSERAFKTGDLARLLPNGELVFAGRADDQIKIRGFRIEPDEIASVINRHRAIVSSAVIARNDGGDKRLVAYLVTVPGTEVRELELRDFLARTLPDYMVPASFVLLDRIPVTANGKLDKTALPVPTEENQLRRDIYVAPGTELEEMVEAIVGPILGLSRVSIHDNFFLLGGHSLMGAQVIAKVRDTFDVELNLRNVFECPTVSKLAAKIESSLVARLEAMSEEEVDQALRGQDVAGSVTFGGHASRDADGYL